ncbi:MAG TPA: hypothetical protein PK185_10435 [Cyclobacteriaceae bacterium]|nr:hypothetical protein [Cyclobacteriaceae bacterium]HRK54323.1 hypothetical protein [Cyclobacteriaceae bacterium]
MKKLLIVVFILGMVNWVSAQSTSDIMIGGGVDFIKTDNPGVFEKSQIGFEVNYFVVRHFAVGLGAEIWSNQKNSFAMGARWYANENVFLKFKGLIGANDVALGAGYAKALTQYLRLEGMGDFYVNSTEFGIRIGLAYVIK